MKKILTIMVSLLLSATYVFAQDVITLKNGDEIQAKVTKVGDKEIEYKKWSNQNGPTYSKPISEIFMIKYENGEKEVYNNTPVQQQDHQQAQQPFGYNTKIGSDRMRRDGRDLYIGYRELTEMDVKSIFDKDDVSTYNRGRRKIGTGNGLVIAGWIVFFTGEFLFDYYLFFEDDESLLFGGIYGMGAGIPLFVVGYILKGIGGGQLNYLVEKYNNGQTNTLSLSVQPSLMHTFDHGIAPGVGLTLRF